MYTGTIFNWHDNSGFEVGTDVVDSTNRPLFMVVNSFDKGPEKIMEVDATTFNSLYGTMSYERHGQGSIQAQKIIDAGGRLLVKRVCAKDSKLANSVLVATIEDGKLSWSVEKIDTAKKFSDVKKYAKSQIAEGKYPLFVITDIGRGKSIKNVRISPDYDTSRGLEKMIYRFVIYEGTTLMESSNISLDPTYQFNDEYYGLDKNRMTQVTAEVIPEVFDKYVDDIVKLVLGGMANPDPEKVKELRNTITGFDLINAYTYKEEAICKVDENYNFTDEVALELKKDEAGNVAGTNLDVPYGIPFKFDGDNGSYKDSPFKFGNETNVNDFLSTGSFKYTDFFKTPMEEAAVEATGHKFEDYKAYRAVCMDIANVYFGFDTDGNPIDEVWDVDSHKLFAIMDANYNKLIKDAMANFVEFRKDCMLFRDCNIGFYSVDAAQNVYEKYILAEDYIRDVSSFIGTDYPVPIGDAEIIGKTFAIKSLRSNFVADYGTTFEVVDPGTKKNIEVTALYDLAEKLTALYIEQGPFAPVAGIYNGFNLDAAIEGTVNFTPIITPAGNQKQAIDDLRLNYAIFEDDQCVVQSNYTSQDKNTQLSFINNVLSIQEVARVVRTVCPRNRFRLITGSDMSEYANAVSRVLQAYNAYFDVLEFQYTEDPLRSIQKIFYASINFSFNNWAQTEIFDLYALSNTSTTSNNG